MKIEKQFKFEAAHVLADYCGSCGNLHGHSYTGTIYVEGPVSSNTSMVVDFNDLTKVVALLDHSFIFAKDSDDEFEKALCTLCAEHAKKVVEIPGKRTTAENIANYILWFVLSMLPACAIVKVALQETSTSIVFAEGSK